MFCTGCGASLVEQARFCNLCGQPVQAATAGGDCLSCQKPLPPGSTVCAACGVRHKRCPECGKLVAETAAGCPGCGLIFGLPAGYEILPGEFEHPSMQQMNQTLRRSVVLNRMAESLSRKVGKPWYESCFNSVQTTEKQYARIHELSMIAARRMGFAKVPSVYIEADRGYQSNTYGSERDAFVNIGTWLPKLLNDREMLFILGHEFGHLKCHHALWMTVSMFLVGQMGGNLMSQGLMSYVSNPLKIIESGVESVIMNWTRVADLTADRAALLIAGDIAVAKRTLFLLYFRSRKELNEVDLDEWTKQQESQASAMTRFSQVMTSATPYLGLRLRALHEFYASPKYAALRDKMETAGGFGLDGLFDEQGFLKKFRKPDKKGMATGQAGGGATAPAAAKFVTGTCRGCKTPFRIPLEALVSGGPQSHTCMSCGKVIPLPLDRLLGRKAAEAAPPPGKPARPTVKAVEAACPKCGTQVRLAGDSLRGKPFVTVQCRNCQKRFRLNLSPVRDQLLS
jgi:Zn-dependent protease with chaperone function